MENMVIDSKTVQPTSTQSSKAVSVAGNKKDGVIFSKLLDGKKSDIKDDSIESKLENLIALLTKVSDKISLKTSDIDTKDAITSTDALKKDNTKENDIDLLSMLSTLIQELNSRIQDNKMNTTVDLSTKSTNEIESKEPEVLSNLMAELKAIKEAKETDTKTSDVLSKVIAELKVTKGTDTKTSDVLTNLISELQVQDKSNHTKTIDTLSKLVTQLEKSSSNLSKASSIAGLSKEVKKTDNETINTSILTLKTDISNSTDSNKALLQKQTPEIQEIKDLVEKILVSAQSESQKSPEKNQDMLKLQNSLLKIIEVVDVAGKEISTKQSSQEVQTFVKPQFTTDTKTTYSNEQGSKDSHSSNLQTSADADKILKKISQQDDSDKTQNFGNLLNRVANNQKESIPIIKTEIVPINKNNVTNDVIKNVKFMEANDIKELTVKINPKDLGEVVIKLTQEGSAMKATITTSNKEAFQLMNSNLQDINNKISSNNTSIQSFSVDVFNGEGSFLKQDSQQNKGSNQGKEKWWILF